MARRTWLIGEDLFYTDLEFLGHPYRIATAVAASAGSVALVDPGPSTCIPALERGLQTHGLALSDVTTILLTHIHLDHAGATGALLRRVPTIDVFVHEKGARHLCNPEKLIDSAARFFGPENMARFWGEILPVPPSRVHELKGGERVTVGRRTFDVLYTPGHASHHVTYLDRVTQVAFVGDTGGMTIEGGYVLPPTPPPDIDVDRWLDSLERIRAARPAAMCLTHFGLIADVPQHLETFAANLQEVAGIVRKSLADETSDEERSRRFGAYLRDRIREGTDETQRSAYEPTAPLEALWFGLARYWRTKGE